MRKAGYRKIHAYAASFGEDLARDLIEGHTEIGDTILDPYSGAATSLLQARLIGRNALGIDIDPIACLIGRVISTSYSLDELDNIYLAILREAAKVECELTRMPMDEETWKPGTPFSINGLAGVVPNRPQIQFWFAPVQRSILAILVEFVKSFKDPRHADLLRLTISSTIIRKWPNTLSLAKDIDHSRPHRVSRNDLSLTSQFEIFYRVLKTVIKTVKNINAQSQGSKQAIRVIQGDACHIVSQLQPNSIDYVLTSPPYFNAIDYPRAHRFSQWWLWHDCEPLNRNQYVGLRSGSIDASIIRDCQHLIPNRMREIEWLLKASPVKYASLCRYIIDAYDIINTLFRVIKPGKSLTIVLANNKIHGTTLPVSSIVSDFLERTGFASINVQERTINSNRRRYPYGIKGFKGLMNSEYLIHATKEIPHLLK